MNAKRLKLFISAYACEPEKGSEPGIGWNVASELARYHEVHVLTRANNRGVIEAALGGRKEDVPVFHYYDLPKWLSFWKKKRRGYRLYYYLWQYGAFFHYRKFVNTFGFDIVEHLTFANFAMPSLFMLCNPVTVYGPIGATSIPAAVFRALPFKVRMKERFRKYAMSFMCRLEPMRVLTPLKADWIIESGMEEGKSSFPNRYAAKIRRHPQTGINTSEPEYRMGRKRADDGKIRLLICSEFFHWKGVIFSSELFVRIAKKYDNSELLIYGSGPEKSTMEDIFHKAGIKDRVRFMGFVSKEEMMQALLDADLLLYPSYHHGLATVILQAMFAGLPIAAMAGDPVALAVSEGAGLTADGGNMEEIMNDLERKVSQMIDSPELRKKLGDRGRELIRTRYEWSVLVRKHVSLLEEMACVKAKQ